MFSPEDCQRVLKAKKKGRIDKKTKSLDECRTQPSPPLSLAQKWFPLAEDRTADSAENTRTAEHRQRKKASMKQIFPRIEVHKDESRSRHSPETPNFAKFIDIVKATHIANESAKSPSEAEGKKPVVLQ
ncbi:hypothetical protein OSTOST_03044 [Ostertagia ostertagi]